MSGTPSHFCSACRAASTQRRASFPDPAVPRALASTLQPDLSDSWVAGAGAGTLETICVGWLVADAGFRVPIPASCGCNSQDTCSSLALNKHDSEDYFSTPETCSSLALSKRKFRGFTAVPSVATHVHASGSSSAEIVLVHPAANTIRQYRLASKKQETWPRLTFLCETKDHRLLIDMVGFGAVVATEPPHLS